LEIYNSQSREILEFGQKGDLSNLNFAIRMPSLEIFGQKNDHLFTFLNLEPLS
jgi:hypothetical protein